MRDIVKEAAIENIEEARHAASSGAHRLEVCNDLTFSSGLTPSVALFHECKTLNTPLFVMIRPLCNTNFRVSDQDFKLMEQQIDNFAALGADGFVLGILDENGNIDVARINILIERAKSIPVTFHKAIDASNDVIESARTLLDTGVSRVLTSGGKSSAIEGIDNINLMQSILGKQITIVAGGGVTKDNVAVLIENTNVSEFHGRKIV